MEEAAPPELLTRGIWRAPYLVDGVPVLIAVDRLGVVRKHLKLRPGVDPVRAADWLEELLNRLDPTPRLELIKPTPPKHHAREVDPRLYEDPRSPLAKTRYWRQLARAAAAKMPRIDSYDS